MTDAPLASSVDPREVARFDRMARDWWDPQGPMRALHRLNPVRLAYIRDTACTRFGRDPTSPRPLDGLTILDVGCGGGVLSEPLSRLGGIGDRARSGGDQHRRRAAARGARRPRHRLPGRDRRSRGGARGRLRHRARHGGGGARGRRSGFRRRLLCGREARRAARDGDHQPDAARLRARHRRRRIRARLAAEGHPSMGQVRHAGRAGRGHRGRRLVGDRAARRRLQPARRSVAARPRHRRQLHDRGRARRGRRNRSSGGAVRPAP